jgi:predicted transcriptional regulator
MISLNDSVKNLLGQGLLSKKPNIQLPRIAIDPQPYEKFLKYTYNEAKRLSEHERACLDMFLQISSVRKHVYPNMETIAKRLGLSVRHTYRIIIKLHEKGLIYKERRSYTSNVYRISSFFKKPEIKRELSDIFVAFRKFMYAATFLVSALISAAQAELNNDVRQHTILKKNIYLNNNNTLIVSNVVSKKVQKGEQILVKPEKEVKEDLYKKYQRPKPVQTVKQQIQNIKIPSRQTYVYEPYVPDTAVKKAQVLCNAIRDFKPSFVFLTVKEAMKFIVKGEYRLTGEKDEDIAVAFLEKKKKEYLNPE